MVDFGVLGGTGASWKAAALLALGVASFGLAGCGLTVPLEPAPKLSAGAADASLVTGSIAPRIVAAAALSPELDQEDWRRARAALATALDPQGNGAAVRWDNADSGHKGSFAPVGNAYLVKDEICRSFVASLSLGEPDRWLQGSACRLSPTEWTIREAKPWKRPG